MSDFSDYNTLIEMKLANNSEVFYDSAMKRQAANDIIKEMLQEYDVPEMMIRNHITFNSNGIVAKPSNYLRMVKLWEPKLSGSITAFADAGGGQVTVTSAAHGLSNGDIVTILGTTSYNGQFTVASVTTNTFAITDTWVANDATGTWSQGTLKNEYVYTEPDVFDSYDTTAAYLWTEDYDPTNSDRRLKVLPTNSGVLEIRYIKTPTNMTDDSTDSGLSTQWDEVVAYGATMKLFQISSRYDEAREMERLYTKRLKDVYLVSKNPGGVKQGNRLKSIYEKRSQLGTNTTNLWV